MVTLSRWHSRRFHRLYHTDTITSSASRHHHNLEWFSSRGRDYIDILYRLGTPPVRQKVILGVIAGALVAHELWKEKNNRKGEQQQETAVQQQQEVSESPSTASLIRAPAHMSILPTWQLMAWSEAKDIMVPPGSNSSTMLSNTNILLPINELDQDLPKLEKVAASAIRSSPINDSLLEVNEAITEQDTDDSTVVDSEEVEPVTDTVTDTVTDVNYISPSEGLVEGYNIPSTLPLPPRVGSLLGGALNMVDNEMNTNDIDGYLESDGWVKFGDLREDGRFTCTIWRKVLDNSPTPQWIMTGDIAVSPSEFHALNADIDNRPTWDNTFEGAKKVDEGDDGSSTLIWKAKWPWPFSPRLYRYRQIPLVLSNNDTRAMLSLGLEGEGNEEEEDNSCVRVTDYISVSCVKPNDHYQEEEESSLKSRYCLYYYEDPKVGTSMPAWLERNVAESTLPKMVSNIVSAVTKYPNNRLEKYKDVGLKKDNIKKEDNRCINNTIDKPLTTVSSNKGTIRRRSPPYVTPLLYQWQPPPPTPSAHCSYCADTKENATPTTSSLTAGVLPFVFTPLDVIVRLYESL